MWHSFLEEASVEEIYNIEYEFTTGPQRLGKYELQEKLGHGGDGRSVESL